MTTRRLFLALNATDPLSQSFLPTYKKIKINADRREIDVKWVPLDNFHVTVTFFGDTPEQNIPRIEEVLNKVCENVAPFDLKIDDVGAFSNEHDARVLWLGVQKKRRFQELKEELENTFLEAELLKHKEDRDFSPHLTFGRLRNPRSVKDMISPFKRKSFGKIHVSEVVLYESKLQGNYPVYIPIYRAKLTGEEKPLEEEAFLTNDFQI